MGIKYVLSPERPMSISLVVLLIVVPVLALLFRELILVALSRKKYAATEVVGVMMEDGMSLAEALITYLANTVSFARVGAFALSHAGLMIAVFSLEAIVRGLPGGSFWAVITLILGNALVIALEGLIVFVQCLRLEYYEFFSKFFEGTGRPYRPFRIG